MFIDWWQHIPEHLDPIVFSIGFFSLRWYAVFFLLGWGLAYRTARFSEQQGLSPFLRRDIPDVFFWVLVAAVSGARIGYGFLYDQSLLTHPLRLVSPVDASGAWVGISGMSYFGGALGVIIALYFLSRSRKIGFFAVADFLAPLVPLAIFSGRLGNFFNLELLGTETTLPWGMHFPLDAPGVLRHPSSLYEAFFEGVVLFFFLRLFRGRRLFPGALSAIYLISYGMIRFILEYFRASEGFTMQGLERWVTPGQLFSLISIAAGIGIAIAYSPRTRRNGILKQ